MTETATLTMEKSKFFVKQCVKKELNFKMEENRITKKEKTERIIRTVIQIKRTTKVTKGGRQFHFAALVLTKEEKSIGFGYVGGAADVATAIKGATDQAKKNLVTYFSEPPQTIPYDLIHSFKKTTIKLFPAPVGSGIIAGELIASIFKYLEIQDVSVKIIGSSTPLNVVRCTFQALGEIN